MITGGISAGYLGYNSAKTVFDKNDEMRARAKELKNAVRYYMQLHQPRIVVSPISSEEEENSGVKSMLEHDNPNTPIEKLEAEA